MKKILQALRDEVYYPINDGLLENKLIGRDLDPSEEFTRDILNSSSWKGALADTLLTLIQAVNVSEGDKSFGALSDAQRKALIAKVNNLYKEIGEEEPLKELNPTVYINC